jgi:hypothetical protein
MTLVIKNHEPDYKEPEPELKSVLQDRVLTAVRALAEVARLIEWKYAPDEWIPEGRMEDLRAKADAVVAAYKRELTNEELIAAESRPDIDTDPDNQLS